MTMRFYRIDLDGYLLSIGTGNGGEEITETEYNQILTVIQNKPTPPSGHDYRLKSDLTWELFAVEEPEEDDLTADEVMAELESIL